MVVHHQQEQAFDQPGPLVSGFDPIKIDALRSALPNVRVLLSDFDGVILKDNYLYELTTRVMLAYGVSIDSRQLVIESKVAAPFSEFGRNLQHLLGVYGFTLVDSEIESAIARARDEILEDYGGPMPFELLWSARTIADLSTRYAMGIVTARSLLTVDAFLEDSQILDAFPVRIGRDQISKPKPDPEGLLLALEQCEQRLGESISLDQVLFLGDMHTDMVAADAAGIIGIGVVSPMDLSAVDEVAKRLYGAGAHAVVDSVNALPELAELIESA